MGSVILSLLDNGPGVMTHRDLMAGELPILEETRDNFVFPLISVEGAGEPPLNTHSLISPYAEDVQVLTSEESKELPHQSLGTDDLSLAGVMLNSCCS